MSRLKVVVLAIGLAWAASVYGSPTGTSIGINFAADEPNGVGEASVDGAAGVAGTVNWNNVAGATGFADGIVMDVAGTATGTGVEVDWLSNGTWASDGQGEDNNDAPDGNDRSLMLGYLDTSDVSITEVNIDGLPAEMTGGFDVFVYVLGGVLGRGGTYTVTAGDTQVRENIQISVFEGPYIEGEEGNYLFFEGFSGSSLSIEAEATTTALFRAPLNAIEICASGECVPRPNPIAGRGTIGDETLQSSRENEVFGQPGNSPGLAQEWLAEANPGNKDDIDVIFEDNTPIVSPFRAGHGASWWTGSDPAFGDLVKYPDEVQPPLNAGNNDNYVVRATGDVLIPESGPYRFCDGADNFTYLAVDADKSGVAGDSPEEVLINDNDWTDTLRIGNNGGGGLGEIEIDVAAEGEWLAIEFNMGENGGGDGGVIYWDYDPDAPEGQRLGGQEGFPEIVTDPIDGVDAETMFIPDTHLRSVILELISADLVGTYPPGSEFGFEFDIDADADAADRLVMDNPDPTVFTTILEVDGITLQMAAIGDLQEGDSFQIVEADQINGTPVITSAVPDQGWSFDPSTGRVTFGAPGILGDYDNNGQLDAGDLDLQAIAITGEQHPPAFDLTGDGRVDFADRQFWIDDLKNTWMGDANLDGQFNSSDQVQKFVQGKYETGQTAGWADGDSNGDTLFNSSDMVADFVAGGYEKGPPNGGANPAVSAVPEPGSVVLALLGLAGLVGLARRGRR